VIASTLLTLLMHVQVLPALDRQYDIEPGVVAYAEVPPSTRLSLSVVKGNNGTKVQLGAKWRF
jgi:hypothetical protein